jgi:L-ascorbate metabolism protein UlaG (beta-lactamase superfamily)
MLVPAGTKDYFVGLGFIHVYEHDWWQSCVFKRNNDAIEFTFVPAVHWSGRNIFDAHTSLWGGWIIKAQEKTVYFAGDTGFSENICNAIAAYAPSIDCALLPIGWTL